VAVPRATVFGEFLERYLVYGTIRVVIGVHWFCPIGVVGPVGPIRSLAGLLQNFGQNPPYTRI